MQKELKQKTGRTNDDHQFKRTINFNLRLSPVEYESIVQQWENPPTTQCLVMLVLVSLAKKTR
jgi:hypothetical protein